MSSVRRLAIQFSAPESVRLVEQDMPELDSGEVRVRTTLTAVSPGTERLIYRGQVPSDLALDPSIPSLDGDISFPLLYGYSAVGRVEAVADDVDEGWTGRRVFSFQPHVSRFHAPTEALIPVPEEVRDEDAVLIPNLETAVNVLMDARPVLGEKVVVFGQGVVGLLTTALSSRYPLDRLYTVEPNPNRRSYSTDWGADRAFDPGDVDSLRESLGLSASEDTNAQGYQGADLIFELTGTPSTLDTALSVAGYDGRIVVGSWYGTKEAPIGLGGRFHRSRISIVSSQVSSIAPEYRGRWSKKRRLKTVVGLLPSVRPGDLVTKKYAPEQARTVYEDLAERDGHCVQPVFSFE